MSDEVTLNSRLAALSDLVAAVCRMVPTDDELADTVGELNRLERQLAATRRRWEKAAFEMPPVRDHDKTQRVDPAVRASTPTAQGQRYELVPQYKTVRSFNTPSILVGVQRVTEWDTWRVLLEASRAGAVRFTWRYTDLKKFLASLNVPLAVGFEEVDDDSGVDAPMVGEVRRESGVKKVPIEVSR